MSICINIGGKEVNFRNFAFDNASSTFKSELDVSTGLSLSIAMPISIDKAFDAKDFLVYFLTKKGLAESEIFQVFDKSRDRRIGWCIPVNALSSVEHDYASNIHFQRYAYAGLKSALNSLQPGIYLKRPLVGEDAPLYISEILPESTALLIISKETLFGDFEISRWIPALAALGYFQLASIDPENICVQRERVSVSQVHLMPTSEDIGDLEHLITIYSHAYPFEKKALFQFFYLYQIIELLMELVFKKEQSDLVKKIVSAQYDINATKELLDGAHGNTSEKRRMGLLARNYCHCESETGELVCVCNELLRLLNKEEGASLETTIYPIRNFLFHQFRSFPGSAEKALERVIISLSSFLPVLLANFRYPAVKPQPVASTAQEAT